MIKQFLGKLVERDILTTFCTFAAIGIIGLIYDLYLLIKRKTFGEKYLLRYEQWILHSRFSNEESHETLLRWLQRNSTKIDNEMGGTRRIDFYRSSSENQAILNRHIGELDDLILKKLCELINPFAWFTRTVRLILLDIPFWMLRSVGLININIEKKIKDHSWSGKVIGLIAFFGALASIISLVFLLLEWDPLVKFLNRIFG
ncbi:MAG: hypothetical protein OXH00_13125 [Candidatus Poribacteria bacterium]|nr:hypothetical protein [Candidatus Poribacteria bacterium]